MLLAFVAPLGLVIGSFLNVVAYRLPRGESIVKPRSRCTSCGTEVRALDNIPLVSWLVLRGRCRHCRAQISARYPVVELVTGVVFALVRTGKLPELLIAGAAAFTLLLLAALAYPGGMGMGDVKLAGVMGLCLGLAVAPALLIAFFAGSVVGLGIMLRHGAGARKKAVPFGPFLALGGLVALVAGNELVHLYAHAFLSR